jgi:hypothetical protein
MVRLEYLAQIILGGVGLATLFKLIAVIGLLLMPNGPDGPMTRTFERAASVGELTREFKPFVEPLVAPRAGVPVKTADVPVNLAELGDLRPTPDKVNAVLVAAEACYPRREDRDAGLESICNEQRLAKIEALVRWWAVFALCATILLGGLGWWVSDQLRTLSESRGRPRSAAGLKRVFENPVKNAKPASEAKLASEAMGSEARKPKELEDLISGDFRFSFTAPGEGAAPEDSDPTFWLFAGLIVAASGLIALSGGIVVAAIMVVVTIVILPLLRIGLARLKTETDPYALRYVPVERPDPAESPAQNAASPARTPDSAQPARTEIGDIARSNLKTYESFLKHAHEEVAKAQNPTSREQALVLMFGLGLLMVLFGNWGAAHLIDLIHGWVFPSRPGEPGALEWALSEGLAAPVQLWSALGFANAADGPANGLVRPVLLAVLAGLLALSLALAFIAGRRPSRSMAAVIYRVAAILASWALFVCVAAVLTWLAGLPEARPPGPAVLVRAGLVCGVASTPVTEVGRRERAGESATWAFGDDGRAAFELGGTPCTLDNVMRYPNPTPSELMRAPARAELAIVVGLASFEGAVKTEEKLAADRASALAREHDDLRVLSIVLGKFNGPVTDGGVGPASSAPQRKVLVYLAGRRGSGTRQTPLVPAEEARLLRELRRDLEETRGLDLDQYTSCMVQSVSGSSMAPNADLTAAFGCPPQVGTTGQVIR